MTKNAVSGICNVCKICFRIRIVCLVSLLSYLYQKVESVQHRFKKRLKSTAELQYFERLAILGAETLELRLLKADLMYIYKIVFDLLDVEHGTFDIKLKGGTSIRSGTHSHEFCVEKTYGRINARRNLLSFKVARVWNCLPANATNFKSQSSSCVELSPCQCYQF